MNDRRAGGLAIAAAMIVLATACQHHAAAAPRTATAPVLPPEVSVPTMRPASPSASQPMARQDTSTEPHVTIDTHGRELDVRVLLDYLATQGHFSLVFSQDIRKRIRLQLNDVPVSVALQTVLTMADLTLESTTEPSRAPGSTSVVFYELPVNVDSLSVDAIMKRFGVGRGIAEMLVKARTEKP